MIRQTEQYTAYTNGSRYQRSEAYPKYSFKVDGREYTGDVPDNWDGRIEYLPSNPEIHGTRSERGGEVGEALLACAVGLALLGWAGFALMRANPALDE